MNLVEVKGLNKSFQTGLLKRKVVLKDVDLTIRQGDFVVLRGQAGAGKSTLIKIILGLQSPDNGIVRLFGRAADSPESKLQLGTVFQEINPPNNLKVKELVSLIGSYYPNSQSCDETLKKMGLIDKKDAFPSDLSGGEKQRLHLAIALMGSPKLLILDEPTTNLDKEGQKQFWQKIEQLKKDGISILMITHVQSEQEKLQEIATQIVVLSDGILRYEKDAPLASVPDNPDDFYKSTKPYSWLGVLFKQSYAEVLQLLRNPAYIAGIFLFSGLVAFIPLGDDAEFLKTSFIFFSAISLLLFSIDRAGKRIAIERVEGWTKLLRVTPLRPSLYIAAKLVVTILILIASLSTIFSIGILKLGIHQSFSEWAVLSVSLLLGIIPFATIGLALGYVVPPKALDSISGLFIPVGIFSCGLVPIQSPKYLSDLIVLSPFFHYRETILYAMEMEYDNRLPLHITWLLLYAIVAGFVTRFSYQRDSISS